LEESNKREVKIMGFINAYLTPEEKKELKNKAIDNPIAFGILDVSWWTIDRENDIRLIWAGTHRDFPYENYFVLLWKGEIHPVSFVKEYPSIPNTVRWSKKNELSEYIFPIDAPFVDDLRNALLAYKIDGSPDDLKSEAICDF